MLIDISTLPKSIQSQLPLSIRTFKTVYEFSDLPIVIQHLIKEYQLLEPEISYKVSFDLIPTISEYSDLKSIDNTIDLVVEYLKNYLVVLPGSYPFDPIFGCGLKYHIQTKDTSLRETLVSTEINNIIQLIQSMLNVNITVNSIDVKPTSMGSYTEFNVKIDISVNNTHKYINLEFS